MFGMRIKLFVFIMINYNNIIKSLGLEILTTSEDNTISVTDNVIRNTTNTLFSTINKRGVKVNPKIRQFSTIHNFFTSLTLRDQKTLNTIVRLSRVSESKKDNDTEKYVDIINEILDEDSKDDEETKVHSDEELTRYVNSFLENLDDYKNRARNNNTLDVNAEILRIFQDTVIADFNMTQYNEVDTDDSSSLDDNEFWVPDQQTRRIYRGKKTKVKYFPFMASIQIFDSFQCGGSIIKADLVLTAASCLQLAWNNRLYRENPAFLSVRVGSNFYNGGGENIPVLEIYFHPEYNPKTLRNNLSVLRLVRRLKFRRSKRRLKKIEIDRQESPLAMTTDGITIVGWGARGTSNLISSPWANRMAFAVLGVYHWRECQEIYSSEYVTRKNFCAGFITKGSGACNRDVGDPGVVDGYLAGVVSFGSPLCGAADAPTVFTKVGYYAQWIDEIMDMDVPHTKVRTTTPGPKLFPFPETPLPHAPKTTFKVTPIINRKPPLINPADTLRILEDEDLFKEFLSTMFSGEQANEYINLLNTAVAKTQESKEIKKNLKDEVIDTDQNEDSVQDFKEATKMYGYESATETYHKVTVIGNDLVSRELEGNIDSILIDNMPSSSEEPSGSEEFSGLEIDIKENDGPNKKQPQRTQHMEWKNYTNELTKKAEDDVLTLLYLSDNETKPNFDNIGRIIRDIDENFSGLPLSPGAFKDFTNRKENNNISDNLFDFISKTELHDLLNEVFDEVIQNKTLN